MSFKIVVDSCCDLSPQMLKDPCFVKVPLTIRSNGSTFVDDEGFDRAIVVLTQDRSYKKGPYPPEFMAAARARYTAYPYLLDALETRHDRYNAQREHIWEAERAGKALVIAPSRPVEVGHVERSAPKLLELYIEGRQEAERHLDEIAAFLG